MSADAITIALLADHPRATVDLQRLFESEWSDYYGAGGPGTATARSLMRRLGWEYLESAHHRGEDVAVFRKRLDV